MEMQYYNAKVRNNGDVRHEVFKTQLSTPEIHVLRELHGPDAIINIEECAAPADNEFDDHEERQRLEDLYSDGLAALENKNSIKEMFRRDELPRILAEFRPKTDKMKNSGTKVKKPEEALL